MRGHPGRLLGELEVVLELLALGLLALLHAGHHPALGPQPFPQRGGQVGVLRDALHQDGAGTGERRGGVPDRVFGVEVLGRFAFRVQLGALEQGVGERLQPGFAGDLRLGAPLGFEREVDVLQPGFGVGADDGGLQFRGQRTLGGDRFEDGPTAVLELAQVAQPLLELAELGVIQRPGGFLAVPGDERHGGPGVEQVHGGLDLPGRARRARRRSGRRCRTPGCAETGSSQKGSETGEAGRCGSWVTQTILPYAANEGAVRNPRLDCRRPLIAWQ